MIAASGLLNISVRELLEMPVGDVLMLLLARSAKEVPVATEPAKPEVVVVTPADLERADAEAKEALRQMRLARRSG